MTGHGGWPLTVFLDARGVPFYAGTYFPPEPRQGMPSFAQVMEAVIEAWQRAARRDPRAARRRSWSGCAAARGSSRPTRRLARAARRRGRGRCARSADPRTAASAARRSSRPPRRWSCCCAAARPRSSRHTLDAMPPAASTTRSAAASPATRSTPPGSSPTSRRCSTTTRCWPAPTCTAGRSLGHERYRRVCEETLDWALREMRGPEGGFYSALDADSEGEEGSFYVWTPDEIRERRSAAPADADEAIELLRASPSGQLRGRATSSTCRRRRAPEPPSARRGARARSTRRARSASGPGSTTSASPPGTR